jgi:hypothetical protein
MKEQNEWKELMGEQLSLNVYTLFVPEELTKVSRSED